MQKSLASLQHPLVKHWVSLRSDKSYRQEHQRLLISGRKQIEELSREIPIHRLISVEPSALAAEESFLVPEEMLKKITALQSPDGLAAEVSLPRSQDLSEKKYLLILDKISDPGNLGALLRTAYALKWDGVITTPSTVDLFNDKVLRASKGALFRLPFAQLSLDELSVLLEERPVFVADTEGKTLSSLQFDPPLALVLSSEGAGPDPFFEKKGRKVTIPMNAKAESLNVAASGAILLYSMRGSA